MIEEEKTLNQHTLDILEYQWIKNELKAYIISPIGEALVEKMAPSVDIEIIENRLREMDEVLRILEKSASIPIHGLEGILKIRIKLEKNLVLQPEDLQRIEGFLLEGRKLKKFMRNFEYEAPLVSSYALSFYELEEIVGEIQKTIRHGRVDDQASPGLERIRKKLGIANGRLKEKLDGILRSPRYSPYLQENLISKRGETYVVPIKSEHQKHVEGRVVDRSASGMTVFIEPREIARLSEEVTRLRGEEEKEEYQILFTLTGLIQAYQRELNINSELMGNYDFLIAKGKYSQSIGGRRVLLNDEGRIKLRSGRHPQLKEEAVPLNAEIGGQYRGLIITGPNTGGKTVAIKTLGLLTLMVQSGLHIPVEKHSEMAVFEKILVDIGDGQSIEQNLSTFSSHIGNVIHIIKEVNEKSLVIMDELGAGTDPAEGTGLATSILEKLHQKGAMILATTHYNEIKRFALEHPAFTNGSMAFDIRTLKPLYRLEVGSAGESNAFHIALRLGLDHRIIERAHQVTYGKKKAYDPKQFLNEEKKGGENTGSAKMENPAQRDPKAVDIAQHRKKPTAIKNELQKQQKLEEKFSIGDSVHISSLGTTGIVYQLSDSKGEVGVMVKKKKLTVNHKRLRLHIKAEDLYPEDYDMDIVFESKDYRKKKHQLERKYDPSITIEYDNKNKA
jgi:DNA mismatch repair protein MutS2